MRTHVIVGLLLAVVSSGALAAPPGRFVRCCLVLPIPAVPPVPTCVQLRAHGRRVGPRRACRLLGGRPIGRGDCSLAACTAPSARVPVAGGRSDG